MVGGQLDDAVAEANALGPLARRGEEDFGLRRVGILLQEVMLDLPRIVVAELVGELYLGQSILIELLLVDSAPTAVATASRRKRRISCELPPFLANRCNRFAP